MSRWLTVRSCQSRAQDLFTGGPCWAVGGCKVKGWLRVSVEDRCGVSNECDEVGAHISRTRIVKCWPSA